ncbi:MAG: hypothetical protein ACKV2T_26540 [Kofleriaceae bacterium]
MCRTLIFAVVLATIACATTACSTDPEPTDGPGDEIPFLVQTDLVAPPLFAAIRGEGDPWQQVPFDGTGRFEFALGGAYELLYVCEDSGRTWTQVIHAVTTDGLSRTIGCVPIAGPAPTVTVSGEMQQPGTVHLGFGRSRSSSTGPWTWSMQVPRGIYDVVAHDGDRISVQRSLEVDDAMTVAPIDLANGMELTKTRMRFTGVLGDEAVTTRTLWLTENGLTVLGFDGDVVRELPEALLTANDATIALAQADSRYTHRETLMRSLPDVFFPPRLEGIELSDAVVRWDTVPIADAWFTVTTGEVDVLVVATPRWLVGRKSLRTDFTMDGYRDEWRVDTTKARRRQLAFELDSGAITSYGHDVFASP